MPDHADHADPFSEERSKRHGEIIANGVIAAGLALWTSQDGRQFFQMYGADGGLEASIGFVIIKPQAPPRCGELGRHGLHERDGATWFVVEFNQYLITDEQMRLLVASSADAVAARN